MDWGRGLLVGGCLAPSDHRTIPVACGSSRLADSACAVAPILRKWGMRILPLLLMLAGAQAPGLGPVDGHGLPPSDLNRVQAGDMAPDFRLEDDKGAVHQLSQYRGRNVVLVFYRGHW